MQQFWFWPVGSPLPGVIGGEARDGPHYAVEPRFKANGGPRDPKMAVKRTANPKGYQVEVFLPVEVFRKPDLTPGRIIACDFSINNGIDCYLRWTTDLGKHESSTPSLWGDLLLLGSDATVKLVKPGTEEELTSIVGGEPIGLRLADADMNLDRKVRDRVKVKLAAPNGSVVTGYLEETGANTGTFAGSVDTEPYELHEGECPAGNVLQVASGERVEVSYLDQARKYGERNFEVRQTLPVGVPVARVAAAP
jgi:hypothetical protein